MKKYVLYLYDEDKYQNACNEEEVEFLAIDDNDAAIKAEELWKSYEQEFYGFGKI